MTRNFISFFFYFLGRIMISWKWFLFLFCWNEFSLRGTDLISWDRILFRGEDFFSVGKNFISLERIFVCWNECYFVRPNVASWGGFFFRRKEFHFVGTNFCLLERMLISWERMLFRGEEFFFRRNEFLFESTQADVLKMSCCPLSFGITPPQQTKQ